MTHSEWKWSIALNKDLPCSWREFASSRILNKKYSKFKILFNWFQLCTCIKQENIDMKKKP